MSYEEIGEYKFIEFDSKRPTSFLGFLHDKLLPITDDASTDLLNPLCVGGSYVSCEELQIFNCLDG